MAERTHDYPKKKPAISLNSEHASEDRNKSSDGKGGDEHDHKAILNSNITIFIDGINRLVIFGEHKFLFSLTYRLPFFVR